MISMKNNSKTLSAILALSLLSAGVSIISTQATFAATPDGKSISKAAAQKLLKAAYTKSEKYISKSPYTISTKQYNGGNSLESDLYTADNKGNVLNHTLSGDESILIGNEYYTTEETGLNDNDLAIARKLGLNIKAKFSHAKITEMQPPMSKQEWNESLRSSAIRNFTSSYQLSDAIKSDPKGRLTLKTQGNKQILTFTDSLLGNRDLWTIENGMVTSHVIYNNKNKIEYNATLLTTAAKINAPKAPYFELGVLMADPKFKASQG